MTKELLLPLYFASSGIKTNIGSLTEGRDWGYVVAIICIAVAVKFIPGFLVSHFFVKREWRFSVTFGFLMNTRGLVELIALNVGLQTGVLSTRLFTILIIMAIITTLMTSPLLWTIYKIPYQAELDRERHARMEVIREAADADTIMRTASNASFVLEGKDAEELASALNSAKVTVVSGSNELPTEPLSSASQQPEHQQQKISAFPNSE